MPTLADIYPTAFVTGASAGLGRAFTGMLLEEGVRVWGTSRDAGRLTELASAYPALFTPVVLDLGAPEAGVAAFQRAAKAAGGGFDVVVNNAGYGVFGPFEAAEFTQWRGQLESMVLGTFALAHEALRQMRARGRGCLVNVSSVAVEFPLPFMAAYNAAKAALSALSESLIVETRGTGITVVDFRPGDFQTGFNQSMKFVTSAGPQATASTARAWNALERNLRDAPPVNRAADDLRRVLRRRRSGMVRTGGMFQTSLAPLFARLAPASWRRWAAARYFGL